MTTAVRDDLRDALGPHHIGDALPLGCEVGAHNARAWVHRFAGTPGKCAVKIDFVNAHNEADRANFLGECRRRVGARAAYT